MKDQPNPDLAQVEALLEQLERCLRFVSEDISALLEARARDVRANCRIGLALVDDLRQALQGDAR